MKDLGDLQGWHIIGGGHSAIVLVQLPCSTVAVILNLDCT